MNGQNVAGTIRLMPGSKGRLLLLLVLSADWHARMNKLAAADAPRPGAGTHKLPWVGVSCPFPAAAGGQPSPEVAGSAGTESPNHPYIDEKEVKSDTCLTCHPTKNQGKYVHTAVGRGCDNCHEAISKNGQTVIALRAQGGSLCAKCHAINNKRTQHAPYAEGQCLICHDPHAGAYPAETRAAVSTLCLVCHMPNQPGAAMMADHKHISVFGIPYDAAAWGRAPKVTEQHFEEHASAGAREPSDRPRHPSQAGRNCLTCHEPHASQAEYLLLRRGAETRGTERPIVGTRHSDSRFANKGYRYLPDHQGAILRGHA